MIKKWLIRGDTHGNFNWMDTAGLTLYNPEETGIIILGDAGFNFYLNKTDNKIKKAVNKRGFNFYCVRGNHEERPSLIPGMKMEWDDNVNGPVFYQSDYPNIRYFLDCYDYTIDKYRVLVIGGAYSVDKNYRLMRAGFTEETNDPTKTGWFSGEQLTPAERELYLNWYRGWKFDFVLTHTCPIEWQPVDMFLSNIDQSSVDNSMENWLSEVKNSITWKYWCFGHYHVDRLERPHVEQYFNDIEELDNIVARWTKYDETQKLDWWLNTSPRFSGDF